MGRLIKGEWRDEEWVRDQGGRFVRDETKFHGTIERAEAGRYHLYVSWACPWAHRTAIVRKLRKLEDVVGLSVVHPFMGEDGWSFDAHPGSIPDTVNHARFLRELYVKADPEYTGRVTVPVLWDKVQHTIVNNESRKIIRMFDVDFRALGDPAVDFAPEPLRSEIDARIDEIYQPVNNGVYRAGFATTQEAYEEAVTELFGALDGLEALLGKQRYLCGDRITEADWCLFTTLLRFDAVYYGHFKCNLRRIAEYVHLSGFLRELYQLPGVAETCRIDHIKQHYYGSHRKINPTGIVPLGPVLDLDAPAGRER